VAILGSEQKIVIDRIAFYQLLREGKPATDIQDWNMIPPKV
jgi:hypothetical protein